ncbi:tetraacyldisaccharide 4'-kinase [Shewanella sp. OPT22]|nr:tetraacyldisaccharide 4'-kinase [Shewanella sp. OPT22]
MQGFVNKIWYQGHWLQWVLLPLSWLFGLITVIRVSLFKLGLKKQTQLPVPVIIVGNITAGGSGKTPMVIYLIELLRSHGYKPGVISRGYGSNAVGEVSVTNTHSASDVGDEPAMIYQRTKVPFVVGAQRSKAAHQLLNDFDVDIIISDDGLQHYALGRDIEIAIVDGVRGLGNNRLIPAGPLREPKKRLSSVDFVVVNGGSSKVHEFSMQLKPSKPISLCDQSQELCRNDVVAFAGIGNPQRFFDTLIQQGFELEETVEFEDHQKYTQIQISSISDSLPIIMTEKDAIKCKSFAQPNWWYLPVDAKLPSNFDKELLERLTNKD